MENGEGEITIRTIKNTSFGFLLVLPSLIVILVVAVVPLAYAFLISLSRWTLGGGQLASFIGLENYVTVLREPRFWDAIYTTIAYLFMTVPIQVVLGTAIALLLNREIYCAKVFRSVMLVPMMVTPVVVGVIWKLVFDANFGVLNYYLNKAGISPPLWLADSSTALWSIAIADIWANTPFIVLLVLAALQSIPNELYEAANVDGANRFRTFTHITLPQLQPVLLIGALFRTIDSLRTFDFIYIMTGGANKTENIVIYTYQNGFRFFRMGETTAQAYILLILTVVFALPLMGLLFKGMKEGAADGTKA